MSQVAGKPSRLRGERSQPMKTIIHQTQAVSTMLLSSRRFRYYNGGLTITGFRFTIPKTSTTLGGR